MVGCVDKQKEEISPKELMAAADSVIVEYDYVKFIFDVERKGSWEWFSENIRTGTLEYQWSASFRLNNQRYNAGFNLFKYPNAVPASGSFDELIEAGQVNLWSVKLSEPESVRSNMSVMTGRGSLVRGAEIQAIQENSQLVIMLKEKSIVAQFANVRPESVSFMTKTPRTNFENKQQAVSYRIEDANF